MMKNKLRLLAAMMVLCLLSVMGASFAAAETSAYIFSYDDMFSKRDLKQSADLAGSTDIALVSGQDVHITEAGVYVLSGTASNVTVYVEAGDDDKVQLVLDGVSVSNESLPVVYVKTADKVFITVSSDSSMAVTGTFAADGTTNLDGVIFSRSDLTMNGEGKLTLTSTQNGIVCKDDLKITGGTYDITAASKALEANDSIRIADGTLNLTAGTDGLHAENEDDDTKGYVYIAGGTLTITAGDDGIHATSVIEVNDGTITITAAEGIEGTFIQINGGTLTINGKDDGINAARKSSAYTPTIELNGGTVTVVMASGDTDGIDSNGNITINGGTINVTGGSSFDYDGTATYNGGTIIVNGQTLSYIPNQMMGGMGGRGGQSGTGSSGRGGFFGRFFG